MHKISKNVFFLKRKKIGKCPPHFSPTHCAKSFLLGILKITRRKGLSTMLAHRVKVKTVFGKVYVLFTFFYVISCFYVVFYCTCVTKKLRKIGRRRIPERFDARKIPNPKRAAGGTSTGTSVGTPIDASIGTSVGTSVGTSTGTSIGAPANYVRENPAKIRLPRYFESTRGCFEDLLRRPRFCFIFASFSLFFVHLTMVLLILSSCKPWTFQTF